VESWGAKAKGGPSSERQRMSIAAHLRLAKRAEVTVAHQSSSDKLYLIRFKGLELSFRLVMAARAEIHGEHLVFLRSDGKLATLFLLEIVENWSEFELYNA
jgi:hypothetical protein